MKIMFVAGGTGGHINPAIAVANEVKRIEPNAEILFVGTEGRMETRIVPNAGFELKTLKMPECFEYYKVPVCVVLHPHPFLQF